jgi:hypothetical protein
MREVDWSGLIVFALSIAAGIFGFALFGPAGFLGGLGLAVFVGLYVRDSETNKDERISALEERVAELEAEMERLQSSESTRSGNDR